MNATMATPASIAPLLIVVGCTVLLLRPVGVPTSMFIMVGVGVIGLLVPVSLPATAGRVSTARWVAVVAIGIAAIVIARTRTVAVPSSFSLLDIGANALAAVAEEIFFRRLTFGWLMRRAALVTLVLVLLSGPLAGADSAIIIGAVYPTGGSNGFGGLEEFRGVTLAAEYANRQGGGHGRPLRLELVSAESWDADR